MWQCCTGAADLMGVRDEPSVSSSVAYLRRLVAAEVAAGIPESRIVVGGFSQGGYVALRAGGLPCMLPYLLFPA